MPEQQSHSKTSDLRIASLAPLVPPSQLKQEYPVPPETTERVAESRRVIGSILRGEDPRLLAVVGPCSIHDPAAALEYATRLAELREELSETMHLVMRVYFEKPRTRLGWRGLILDPALDGTGDIQTGLRTARKLLLDIAELGLPTGSEMLDPIVPQFLDDLLSWASIGARTTESQTHREMASGLSMPVGFKNGTDGSIESAVNAFSSSMHAHSFIGIDQHGLTCVLNTTGNEMAHVILRGGRGGPNYHDEQVEDTAAALTEAGLPARIMVDCSHMNSRRDHTRQQKVLRSVVRQRVHGQHAIIGFMLESNLKPGKQPIPELPQRLEYGLSITDACIGWDETAELLRWAAQKLRR